VSDSVKPLLTLTGAATQTIQCHLGSYTEQGASVSDACDTALTVATVGGQTVDVNVPGVYLVSYNATDASGNPAQDSFEVTVIYVSPHVATAIWGEPVAGANATFTANRGRTIPIKVELFVDGEVRASGDAELVLSPCATGSGLRLALAPGNGRWNVGLDTSALDGSCYTVTATIDGLDAGSFRLELRGADAVRTNKGKR